MLDIAKCKDLDDWLTGSGVLAETAESKETANFGVKNK
jgi:dsDNA-binding SOS-regulon protein